MIDQSMDEEACREHDREHFWSVVAQEGTQVGRPVLLLLPLLLPALPLCQGMALGSSNLALRLSLACLPILNSTVGPCHACRVWAS